MLQHTKNTKIPAPWDGRLFLQLILLVARNSVLVPILLAYPMSQLPTFGLTRKKISQLCFLQMVPFPPDQLVIQPFSRGISQTQL